MRYKFDNLVVDARTGLNPRKNFELGRGQNNYITIKNIQNGKIVITDNTEKIDDEAIQIIKKRSRIKKGDVLFSSIGRVGDTAIVKNKDDSWDVNESVFIFTLNEKLITPEYFCYMIGSQTTRDKLIKNSTGSTFKSVKMQQLKNMEFEVPSIQHQRTITKKLNNLKASVDIRTKQLLEYDQLSKSRFVEMFGDIFENSKAFRTTKFRSFVEQMNIGPFGSALKNEYFVSEKQGFCMVYEQKHAIQKEIEIEKRYIDFNKYNELKRFEVGPGNIITSARGTIGKCYLLPDDAQKGIIHPSLMMIKPKKNVNAIFLLHLLEKILERQLVKGSGVKMAIRAKELGNIQTIVPEKKLQDEYVYFFSIVDKLKFVILKWQKNEEKLYFVYNNYEYGS